MLSLWNSPLCVTNKQEMSVLCHFLVIITPLWLTLTIFLSSSLLLFVAQWQCYLLHIITLSSWLHILIAVCTVFINHSSCSSIQPFSHQFTYFLLWCSGFSVLFYSFLIIRLCISALGVFFPSLLTKKKYVMCIFLHRQPVLPWSGQQG